jgi:hypothetical protein
MTTSGSCRDFEIAILKRSRAALAEQDVSRLDEHLAGCDACRSFAAVGEVEDSAARARLQTAMAVHDWNVLARLVRAERLKAWPRFVAALGGLAVLPALFGWMFGAAAVVGVGVGELILLVVAWVRDVAPRVAAGGARDADVLAVRRATLDRSLERLRKGRRRRWAHVAIVMLLVLVAELDEIVLHGEVRRMGLIWPVLSFAAFMSALQLWANLVLLPRQKREREEFA